MNTPLPNESELIVLLKAGDKQSFETLYTHYASRLSGFLAKLSKSEYLAAEILQETFMRVWNSRENIDPAQSFRSYLFRIASNLAYDFFRKAARDVQLRGRLIASAAEAARHQAHEDLFNKENLPLLEDAMRQLPPKRQEIFQLIKIEERSYKEVSLLLNISVSTINDHVVKAMKFLRERLAPLNALKVIIIWCSLLE